MNLKKCSMPNPCKPSWFFISFLLLLPFSLGFLIPNSLSNDFLTQKIIQDIEHSSPTLSVQNVLNKWRKNHRLPQIVSKIIFQKKRSQKTRTFALLLGLRLGLFFKKQDLYSLCQDPYWLVRFSALKALKLLSGKKGLRKLLQNRLLKDPALVIRSQSVSLIKTFRLKKTIPSLIQALKKPQNWHPRSKKPYFIISQILKLLSQWSRAHPPMRASLEKQVAFWTKPYK